ncbi:hypothetical protein EIM48_01705 [Pseudoxanthomonas sp. SGNA-20]|jgi:hypothetical protein|uniref:hypothetical protein n=1 Tax=unclassified Pseudoxanthomonas TaxID=2645906 RepID=UPI000F62A3F0|nr:MULTISPECIES: hypothetical protein [unclassified Pseudoxanthomonas]RRN58777.1 hypothetical protein EIM48_01705 [Pseudoxanthomonas sp. SGNA-20]RRN80750.1 hypothetical protein EIM50_02745 [Pseudoxanthomonas sp. SGD-10]
MVKENPRQPAPQRAGLQQRLHDFGKAYRKARQWRSPPVTALLAAWRFALTGDSGRFVSHDGARLSRIYRGED